MVAPRGFLLARIAYVYSLVDAGKVKRISNRSEVRIAPCDISGRLEGEWVAASERIVTGEEAALGHRLLDRNMAG